MRKSNTYDRHGPMKAARGTKNIKRRVHVLPIEIELSSMAPRHDTAAPWQFEQDTAGSKNDDNTFLSMAESTTDRISST